MPLFKLSSRGPLIAGRALFASLFLLAVFHVGPARAGTYVLYSCRHPDGSPAPTEGWTPTAVSGGSTRSCLDTPGYLSAALTDPYMPQGASAVWTWTAKGDVRLRAIALRRSYRVGFSYGPGTTLFRITAPEDGLTSPFLRSVCHSRMICDLERPPEDVVIDGIDGGSVFFRVDCANAACEDRSSLGTNANLYSAAITLEDSVPPRADGVAGSLTSGQALWGSAELTYRATDIGGGVYRHRVAVDGRTVLEEVADANGGRCRDAMPGWGTAYEFDHMLPCPLAVEGRMNVDLNDAGVGHHRVEASIEDAAGNRRTIYEGSIDVLSDPARRTFDAQGVLGLTNPLGDRPGLVPNGVGAGRNATVSAWIGRKRRGRASATYPRAPRVHGRLTTAGQPVSGATVAVVERDARSSVWRATAAVTTSASGEIDFVPAPGPSRTVRFAYVPDSEATSALSSNEVRVDIRPKVVLTPSPRRLRTGQRVRFSGRVLGVVPASNGVLATLQAGTSGSKWVTFRVLRTAADGRFRASYRFTRTRGRVRYRFRAVVPRQASHPFERGTSPSAWVRVSG